MFRRAWQHISDWATRNPFNFSGCIDVVVVEDALGALRSTSFHMRVSRVQLLGADEQLVEVWVNGARCEVSMALSAQGIGYWPNEDEGEAELEESLSEEEPPQTTRFGLNRSADCGNEESVSDSKSLSGQIELSLCKHLISVEMTHETLNNIFCEHKISFHTFDRAAESLLADPRLMIRIGESFYDASVGLPQLVALAAFGSPLTPLAIAQFTQSPSPLVLRSAQSQRTRRPGNRTLAALKLKAGVNRLQYKLNGNFGVEIVLEARIFYYPHTSQRRIVVSDVDGTITRSDFLGHIMPFLSRDWSHGGIANLFNELARRGYTIVYLTARSMSGFGETLSYLRSLRQNGVALPEGPLFASNDSLLASVRREIITREPEAFKIQALRELRSVFGAPAQRVFYAGFGNKDSDALAYRVLSIPKSRIYIINPSSDIRSMKNQNALSYAELTARAEEHFPAFEATPANN